MTRTYPFILIAAALPLGACSDMETLFAASGTPPPVTEVAVVVAPPPLAPPPPPAARTVEDFDTTTEADRAAAVAVPAAATETALGTTIASLGSPTDPGIWMETPLVSEVVQGRVEYAVAGTSVSLELRPSGGEAGSGSQISLAAMRLLEAPLTGLPELTVYR